MAFELLGWFRLMCVCLCLWGLTCQATTYYTVPDGSDSDCGTETNPCSLSASLSLCVSGDVILLNGTFGPGECCVFVLVCVIV
jgi:hypothetical protein